MKPLHSLFVLLLVSFPLSAGVGIDPILPANSRGRVAIPVRLRRENPEAFSLRALPLLQKDLAVVASDNGVGASVARNLLALDDEIGPQDVVGQTQRQITALPPGIVTLGQLDEFRSSGRQDSPEEFQALEILSERAHRAALLSNKRNQSLDFYLARQIEDAHARANYLIRFGHRLQRDVLAPGMISDAHDQFEHLSRWRLLDYLHDPDRILRQSVLGARDHVEFVRSRTGRGPHGQTMLEEVGDVEGPAIAALREIFPGMRATNGKFVLRTAPSVPNLERIFRSARRALSPRDLLAATSRRLTPFQEQVLSAHRIFSRNQNQFVNVILRSSVGSIPDDETWVGEDGSELMSLDEIVQSHGVVRKIADGRRSRYSWGSFILRDVTDDAFVFDTRKNAADRTYVRLKVYYSIKSPSAPVYLSLWFFAGSDRHDDFDSLRGVSP